MFNEVQVAVLYPALSCRTKPAAPMEFAENILISFSCSKHKGTVRFAFSWSDLLCHH